MTPLKVTQPGQNPQTQTLLMPGRGRMEHSGKSWPSTWPPAALMPPSERLPQSQMSRGAGGGEEGLGQAEGLSEPSTRDSVSASSQS